MGFRGLVALVKFSREVKGFVETVVLKVFSGGLWGRVRWVLRSGKLGDNFQ